MSMNTDRTDEKKTLDKRTNHQARYTRLRRDGWWLKTWLCWRLDGWWRWDWRLFTGHVARFYTRGWGVRWYSWGLGTCGWIARGLRGRTCTQGWRIRGLLDRDMKKEFVRSDVGISWNDFSDIWYEHSLDDQNRQHTTKLGAPLLVGLLEGWLDGWLDELGVWLGRVVGSFDNDGFSLGYSNQ